MCSGCLNGILDKRAVKCWLAPGNRNGSGKSLPTGIAFKDHKQKETLNGMNYKAKVRPCEAIGAKRNYHDRKGLWNPSA